MKRIDPGDLQLNRIKVLEGYPLAYSGPLWHRVWKRTQPVELLDLRRFLSREMLWSDGE